MDFRILKQYGTNININETKCRKKIFYMYTLKGVLSLRGICKIGLDDA